MGEVQMIAFRTTTTAKTRATFTPVGEPALECRTILVTPKRMKRPLEYPEKLWDAKRTKNNAATRDT